MKATFLGAQREALAAGAQYYFTAKACQFGHVAPRYASSGDCTECGRAKARARYERHGVEIREYQRERHQTCKEKIKASKARRREAIRAADRKRYERDKPKRLILARKWHARNPEKTAGSKRGWAARNKEHMAANVALRRATFKRSAPAWLTPEQKLAIKKIYAEARRLTVETGIRHEVDHIYPLRNRLCCGLHVPWNLQILPFDQNMKKSNRLPNLGETF